MNLLKRLAIGTIVTAGLTIATYSVSEENQKSIHFETLLENGEISIDYYGEGPHNGFKWDRIEYMRVCFVWNEEVVTKASYDTRTMEWTETSPYGTEKFIFHGIEEYQKYREQFMKCGKST